jgi:cell wall-associated NlpC family hydrolase
MFNKQKIAAVSATVIFMAFGFTNCSSIPAEADQKLNSVILANPEEPTLMDLLLFEKEPMGVIAEAAAKAELEAEKQRVKQEKLDANTAEMTRAISKLKKYVGSEYGYGAKPGYWDCSGLVRWFYEQQGVDLYHSASAQSKAGKKVKHPKIGDIVAFHYGSSYWSFHVGIYVGDGKVLHAYNPYADTVISKVSDVASENGAWASYTRIVETN